MTVNKYGRHDSSPRSPPAGWLAAALVINPAPSMLADGTWANLQKSKHFPQRHSFIQVILCSSSYANEGLRVNFSDTFGFNKLFDAIKKGVTSWLTANSSQWLNRAGPRYHAPIPTAQILAPETNSVLDRSRKRRRVGHLYLQSLIITLMMSPGLAWPLRQQMFRQKTPVRNCECGVHLAGREGLMKMQPSCIVGNK